MEIQYIYAFRKYVSMVITTIPFDRHVMRNIQE